MPSTRWLHGGRRALCTRPAEPPDRATGDSVKGRRRIRDRLCRPGCCRSERESTLATFVLVHGAWYGSWTWKRVRTALQAAGHEVFTPTLTGVADRSHLLTRDVNLDTHIQDVVNLIKWEELNDIVLCGHSYGGCVVTGVADRIPEHIRSLVYLDAFVPEDGDTQFQHLSEELAKHTLEARRTSVTVGRRRRFRPRCSTSMPQTGSGWIGCPPCTRLPPSSSACA